MLDLPQFETCLHFWGWYHCAAVEVSSDQGPTSCCPHHKRPGMHNRTITNNATWCRTAHTGQTCACA